MKSINELLGITFLVVQLDFFLKCTSVDRRDRSTIVRQHYCIDFVNDKLAADFVNDKPSALLH